MSEVREDMPGVRVTPDAAKPAGTLTVAIDPATTSGWAAFVDGQLTESGFFRVTTPALAFRLLLRLAKANAGREKRIVVEDQYLHAPTPGEGVDAKEAVNNAAMRFRGTAKVVRIHGWFESAGVICGYEYESALSQQWQGPLGVATLAKLRYNGDRKKASREISKSRYHRDFSSDESDAILLGSWYEVERKRVLATVVVSGRKKAAKAEPSSDQQMSLLR